MDQYALRGECPEDGATFEGWLHHDYIFDAIILFQIWSSDTYKFVCSSLN